MLSFTSSLSPDNEAFAIFVNDKFDYRDKKNVLSKEISKKINSEEKLTISSFSKSKLSIYISIFLIALKFFK